MYTSHPTISAPLIEATSHTGTCHASQLCIKVTGGVGGGLVLISLSSLYSSMYLTMLACFGLMTLLPHIIDCPSKGTVVKHLKGAPCRLFMQSNRGCYCTVLRCMWRTCYMEVSSLIHTLVHMCPAWPQLSIQRSAHQGMYHMNSTHTHMYVLLQ